MLHKIYCNRFHRQNLYFNSNLNVVLGTPTGDNSIGKTTLLMIVDYVFGGETYSRSKDILENIHDHQICFTFRFKTRRYHFSRSFCNPNVVKKCDFTYQPLEEMSLKEFNTWLSEHYDLNYCKLTFRDAVSRYMRIYGKDNCDEKRPLSAFSNDTASNAIVSLLKLFNMYEDIDELEQNAREAKEKLKVYKDAQKHNFITNISKRDYEKNSKQIEALTLKLEEFTKNFQLTILDKDQMLSDRAIELKKKLLDTRRIRNSVKNKLKDVEINADYHFKISKSSFTELKRFFPQINIEHLEEVDRFHREIAKVFHVELEHEKNLLSNRLFELNNIVHNLEHELSALTTTPNFSTEALNQFAETKEKIQKMSAQNSAYTKSENLKNDKFIATQRLQSIKSQYLGEVEKRINSKMEKLNNSLYKGLYNSPVLHLEENSYSFHTPNDTGTGIAYKGVVVFDLAVFQLTNLPILVHDSIILKQISDEAVGNILKQYISSEKQVVIALDKQTSYDKETAKLLQQNSIIELGPDKKALFGRSWSRKSTDKNLDENQNIHEGN